jgi:MFS family permease
MSQIQLTTAEAERSAVSGFSDPDGTQAADGGNTRFGIYVAILQFALTLGWTIYVIYLPQLAARAGIRSTTVIILLLIDQAIFTISDTLMGIAADRMILTAGRLSRAVIFVAALSCIAFLALPFVAELGPGSEVYFIAIVVVWAVTSSSLRAPPLALLGKFAARPTLPLLSCVTMLGYGLAGALSPYLGVVLRNQDPRIPFVVSSVVLLLTALSLSRIERLLRDGSLKPVARPKFEIPKSYRTMAMVLVVALLVLAFGYQLHFSIDSAALFLRFTKQPDLEWLMPVYWIGFSVAMFPASFITRRLGGLLTIGCAGLLGAGAILGAQNATGLNTMLVMQFVAGAAWGCILISAIAVAMAIGSNGAEGKVVGLIFSAIAAATFARLAVASGLTANAGYETLLRWTPIVCSSLAGAALLFIAVRRMRKWQEGNQAIGAPL